MDITSTQRPLPDVFHIEIDDGLSDGIFHIGVNGRGGFIESDGIKYPDIASMDCPFNAAVDGIESFLLALACEGVDVKDVRFKTALETALEKISNTFD